MFKFEILLLNKVNVKMRLVLVVCNSFTDLIQVTFLYIIEFCNE